MKFLVLFLVISISISVSEYLPAQESNGYAPVNGLKMYYEMYGSGGTPLILIHGGGSTIRTTFGNVISKLSVYGKVIAVELQAHGHTRDRDSALSFTQDADDVAGLLKYLNITRADFLGFSNGGNTAMQIAIRHPDLVNKLIIASSFYKREGLIPGMFENLEKATLDDMPAPYKTAFLLIDPDKNHLQAMFNKDRERMLRFKDWKDEDLHSIKAPTLLILADKDVVKPEHGVEMLHQIPNAELMILPGTHGSYLGEVFTAVENSKVPDLTVTVIEEFLRTNPRGSK